MDDSYKPGIDSPIDRVVVSISNDILADTPANDPHWVNKPVGLGSSYAMQITPQIEDKQRSHALFVKFLKESETWKKLGAVTLRNSAMLTGHVLAENSEKIVAALALRARPVDDIIQRAIDAAVDGLDISREGGLTSQNIFYTQLYKFQNVIIEMVANCDSAAHSDMNPNEVALMILNTNVVILDVLQQVLSYRQANAEYYEPICCSLSAEFVPWTAASGKDGLMDSLISLVSYYKISPNC